MGVNGLGSLDPNVLPLDAFELQGSEGDATRKMALKAPWVFSGEAVQIGNQSLNAYIDDKVQQLSNEILSALPIGSVVAWPGSSIPTGWLLCNGQAHGSDDLQAVLGSANVPDYRETALVGVGTRASGVAAHDTFTIGQMKDDATGEHIHLQSFVDGAGAIWPMVGDGGPGASVPGRYPNSTITATKTRVGTTGVTQGRVTSVTRGKRVGVNWIIRKE